MTTLEVKLNLPDQLAREAQAAGLLTSASISKLLKNAMRRRAAKRGSKPMTLEAIQAEVNAVRRSRKADKRA
jgi:post-segregation antitoxin (ccd killing protein)